MDVDHLLLEGCIQDPKMSLARLFDRVILLILCRHDLVQVNLIVQVIVVLESSEWLEHLFHLATKILDECLVFDA